MRIAIFDYRVTARNPAGSCHLALLRALARDHAFTVFSVEFDNPDPENIAWVRVPVPRRPLALLFLCFHLVAPILYIWHCLIARKSFDLVQSVESNLGFGELIYAHFSHTTYLKGKHAGGSGLRGWLRWVDHALHAIVEPIRFRFARRIVVPSRGLQQELQNDLDLADTKIEVIANPIAIPNFERPPSFNRDVFRSNLDLKFSDVVFVFCALGHFERKGLPLLLEALRSPALDSIKLIVVGGEPDLIRAYTARASQSHVGRQIRFAGFQKDARPYLWAADAFILPSSYETFSLAAFEAAAACLPVVAPALNGICDLLADGDTGFVIEPNTASVTHALERMLKTPPAERMKIGSRAKEAASAYSTERFVESWRSLYESWPAYAGRISCPAPARIPPTCQGQNGERRSVWSQRANSGVVHHGSRVSRQPKLQSSSAAVSPLNTGNRIAGAALAAPSEDEMTIGSSTISSAPQHFQVHLRPMPARPKVSILITNYNYEEFLPRSIESALNQSWLPMEIIVSDDGSEDRSCEVVQSYVDRGYPLVLVRGGHRGMAGCLNAAYAVSSGEIVCLLDADDYFLPGKLEAVVSAFQSNPDSGLCIHRTQRIDQSGRMGGVFPLLQSLPSGDQCYSTLCNSGILMGLPPTSALSLRREVASAIFPAPEHYVGYAEQVIHRIAPLVTSICCIEKAFSSWTLHRRNDANSASVKTQRIARELSFMETLWRDQHRFLLDHNPALASELEPLESNSLYVKMRYILSRLSANGDAFAIHQDLCKLPEIRHSPLRMFWQLSSHLPRPIFKKSIDILETQGILKHILGRFFRRESSAACI